MVEATAVHTIEFTCLESCHSSSGNVFLDRDGSWGNCKLWSFLSETLAKSESLQYSKNFSNLPHNSNFHIVLSPHPRRYLLYLVFQQKRQLKIHNFLIAIYNRSVIPMFTPFKLQGNLTFRSPPSKNHIVKQFSHITKCHLLQKYLSFKFSGLLISSSNKGEEGTS